MGGAGWEIVPQQKKETLFNKLIFRQLLLILRLICYIQTNYSIRNMEIIIQ